MRLQYIDFALRHVAFILPEDLNSDLGLSTISILRKHQPTGEDKGKMDFKRLRTLQKALKKVLWQFYIKIFS